MELAMGVSTQIILTCKNSSCNMNEANQVKNTDNVKHKFKVSSAESFAINCQFVHSLLQSGCRSTEAATLITFLDLPNTSLFKKKLCKNPECNVTKIKKVMDFCMEMVYCNEIFKTSNIFQHY